MQLVLAAIQTQISPMSSIAPPATSPNAVSRPRATTQSGTATQSGAASRSGAASQPSAAILAKDPRVTALAHEAATFDQRVAGIAAQLPSTGDPSAVADAKVAPLYIRARALHAQAATLAAALGYAQLFDGRTPRAQATLSRELEPAYNAERTVAQLTHVGEHSHAEQTYSHATKGSQLGFRHWTTARDGRNLPNVRIVGDISPAGATLVASRLGHVPQSVIDVTDALGDRAKLFTGKLTDVWGYRSLRGVHPRGWPAGATWNHVPGAGGESGFAARPSSENPGKDHGSTSLALHEYGHTVDAAMAPAQYDTISDSRTWLDGPWRELRARHAPSQYLHQHSSEWFAEAFARYNKSEPSMAALARWYPQTYHYMRSHFGAPDFHTTATA